MQLYGSNPSPYVRRIRMFTANENINLQYIQLDIFNPEDRAILIDNNPARKIPFLVDNGLKINDSNLIHRYLCETFSLPKLTWWQETQLVNINACNDSLVELLICKRSELDISEDRLFFNLQTERIAEVLKDLNEHCTNTTFLEADYLQVSLYCLLDWIVFRELTSIEPYTHLVDFHRQYSQTPSAIKTDPRT
jgi:glutathione S-transferase